jgi:hypothetical protein
MRASPVIVQRLGKLGQRFDVCALPDRSPCMSSVASRASSRRQRSSLVPARVVLSSSASACCTWSSTASWAIRVRACSAARV